MLIVLPETKVVIQIKVFSLKCTIYQNTLPKVMSKLNGFSRLPFTDGISLRFVKDLLRHINRI